MRSDLRFTCAFLLAAAAPIRFVGAAECNKCSRELIVQDQHCPVRETCVGCVKTEVMVITSDKKCSVAQIKCHTAQSARIRLFHTADGTFIDVDSRKSNSTLQCTDEGWWEYYGIGATAKVDQVACFIHVDDPQQSPINIVSSSAIQLPDTGHREIRYGEDTLGHATIAKDLHGLTVHAKNTSTVIAYSSRHLSHPMRFHQFHAHWGNSSSPGSEHLLDGQRFDGEIHFVHYNPRYSSFANAVGKESGIAVIGVFVKVGKHNEALEPTFEIVRNFIETPKSKETVPYNFTLDPSDLFPEDHAHYSYTGSLTTGNHARCVQWTVLSQPIELSHEQFALLHNLTTSNFRVAQRLHKDTRLWTSEGFLLSSSSASSQWKLLLIIVICIVVLLLLIIITAVLCVLNRRRRSSPLPARSVEERRPLDGEHKQLIR